MSIFKEDTKSRIWELVKGVLYFFLLPIQLCLYWIMIAFLIILTIFFIILINNEFGNNLFKLLYVTIGTDPEVTIGFIIVTTSAIIVSFNQWIKYAEKTSGEK